MDAQEMKAWLTALQREPHTVFLQHVWVQATLFHINSIPLQGSSSRTVTLPAFRQGMNCQNKILSVANI